MYFNVSAYRSWSWIDENDQIKSNVFMQHMPYWCKLNALQIRNKGASYNTRGKMELHAQARKKGYAYMYMYV